jgi:hypothetical protein
MGLAVALLLDLDVYEWMDRMDGPWLYTGRFALSL